MLFNSLEFLVFLPIALGVYYVLSRRAQNVWLLAASWFFYGWWDYRFLTLIAISTVVDYWCGRALPEAGSPRRKRALLLVSVVTNLGILGFFKYFNFFVESTAHVLAFFGMQPSGLVLSILLPMGISFYTFQTMAYTIDVYRGHVAPTRSFVDFALYVSYFPQLVAGPIERASRLLPQLQSKRRVDSDMIGDGLILILLGFFKKVAIADVLAPQVDLIFGAPGEYGTGMLLLGVYMFAVQIYCDFSGYTDIARGVSSLLGVDLMENFRHPYFASTITDFWRRWHISLSSWLKDYLYIPLGGNRHGAFNTYRNLMITMLLGGLWHGASWNFVVWGALHGAYLSIHKLTLSAREADVVRRLRMQLSGVKAAGMRIPAGLRARSGVVLSGLLTFHLVCLAWIFFRADTFSTTATYLAGIASFTGLTQISLDAWTLLRIVPGLLLLGYIDVMQFRTSNHTFLRERSVLWQALVYLLLFACIIMLGSFDNEVPFIYFQF